MSHRTSQTDKYLVRSEAFKTGKKTRPEVGFEPMALIRWFYLLIHTLQPLGVLSLLGGGVSFLRTFLDEATHFRLVSRTKIDLPRPRNQGNCHTDNTLTTRFVVCSWSLADLTLALDRSLSDSVIGMCFGGRRPSRTRERSDRSFVF
jgi:hypothetical protein